MKSHRVVGVPAHADTPERDRLVEANDVAHAASVRPLREVEDEHVRLALRIYNGNKKRAAQALGISRDTLYRKIAEFAGPDNDCEVEPGDDRGRP